MTLENTCELLQQQALLDGGSNQNDARLMLADYSLHMYSAAAYSVIDEIAQLPLKVAEIYRKLTI